MNHIELFAGCGGLSLGLQKQGFELLFANELSPMAAETFAFNILGIDLSLEHLSPTDKIYWLRSQYSRNELGKRLREKPDDVRQSEDFVCDLDDLDDYQEKLRGSLIVGSIRDLNDRLVSDSSIMGALLTGLGDGEVDLISGGPPCQSFSMAGLRQHQNIRNQLPGEFAKFVGRVRPKMVLLENVTGILRAFKIAGDSKPHYAWFEVAKAFALEGYMPICLHVNAKYVGAAQNRPRFIMLAFERTVAKKISNSVAGSLSAGREIQAVAQLFDESSSFLAKVDTGKTPAYGDLIVRDVEKYFGSSLSSIYSSTLFKDLVVNPLKRSMGKEVVAVDEAIDDLRRSNISPSKYVDFLNKKAFGSRFAQGLENHELRNHRRGGQPSIVQSRFRLYQIISKLKSPRGGKEVSKYLRTLKQEELSKETVKELMAHRFLLPDGTTAFFQRQTQLLEHLSRLHTKKQTQRALIKGRPAPAALSIPDDACHYDGKTLRTLSVREMARIQSFPDWFVFRSKVTTGGQMRKYEVPQYTQVGNAVPPLLGLALGNVCKKLLSLAN